MFKHTISFVDFNGTERKEDFYFHLSLPEITRLEAEVGESIETYTKKLQNNKNLKEMIDFLEKFILGAYGRKTSDGVSFYKSEELRKEFEHSQAYAELFEELLMNPGLAQKFGEGVTNNGKTKKNQVNPTVVND